MKSIIDEQLLRKSLTVGGKQYPTRSDYELFFLSKHPAMTPTDVWKNDVWVVEIQRHWHTFRQTGCVFAQTLSRDPERHNWRWGVLQAPLHLSDNSQVVAAIDRIISAAIISDECQAISLLFPQVTQTHELALLIRVLENTQSITLHDVTTYGDLVLLALRIPLGNTRVLSWPLGLGPFSFFPVTRQSPVTELAIRTKPKPEIISPNLTPDRTAAHLADMPLAVSDTAFNTMWSKSQQNARLFLGTGSRASAKAKVTFSLPKKVWEELLLEEGGGLKPCL